MEAKISAHELKAVVTDTNRKVTDMAKKQRAGVPAFRPSSKVASAIVVVLSILGLALSALIFFPGVWETFGVAISESLWEIIYIAYAVIALFIAAVSRIRTPLRVWAVIVAIAPICIQVILGIL